MRIVLDAFHFLLGLLRDPGPFIAWAGYPGLAAIIFLETGAMIFFLPGDSLLFVAGMYASKGDLNIAVLNAILIPMAIAGDATSYTIGFRTGPKIFSRPRSRFFRPEHMKAAHAFYEKHGGKAIVLARFMPLVRTFTPVVAGVAQMRYRDFAVYNVLGGAGWVASMTLLGWGLGTRFPILGDHIEKVIIVIVLLSVLPAVISVLKERRKSRTEAAAADAAKP